MTTQVNITPPLTKSSILIYALAAIIGVICATLAKSVSAEELTLKCSGKHHTDMTYPDGQKLHDDDPLVFTIKFDERNNRIDGHPVGVEEKGSLEHTYTKTTYGVFKDRISIDKEEVQMYTRVHSDITVSREDGSFVWDKVMSNKIRGDHYESHGKGACLPE